MRVSFTGRWIPSCSRPLMPRESVAPWRVVIAAPVLWNWELRTSVVISALYSKSARRMLTQMRGPSENMTRLFQPPARTSKGGQTALAGGAVARLGGIATPDEPARGAEGVRIVQDVRVAVDANRRDVHHLALLHGDRLDPRAVCATDGLPERDDVVLFGDLFVARGREHAHGPFADGIEVGEAVGRGKVIKGQLALDAQDFVAASRSSVWISGCCASVKARVEEVVSWPATL